MVEPMTRSASSAAGAAKECVVWWARLGWGEGECVCVCDVFWETRHLCMCVRMCVCMYKYREQARSKMLLPAHANTRHSPGEDSQPLSGVKMSEDAKTLRTCGVTAPAHGGASDSTPALGPGTPSPI